MIVSGLLNLIYKLFELLTTPIAIPQLPNDVGEYLYSAMDYIVSGFDLIATFFPLPYIGVLFGIIIAIDVGVSLYHFVMWVLKKIPMLGIS